MIIKEYILFSDEQKHQANTVDLEDYLLRRGEKLLPSGRDKRLATNHSVTIRGSEWFDHDTQQGGHAIDFVRMHDGCSFQEAVAKLLGGEQGQTFRSASERNAEPQKLFALPLFRCNSSELPVRLQSLPLHPEAVPLFRLQGCIPFL